MLGKMLKTVYAFNDVTDYCLKERSQLLCYRRNRVGRLIFCVETDLPVSVIGATGTWLTHLTCYTTVIISMIFHTAHS